MSKQPQQRSKPLRIGRYEVQEVVKRGEIAQVYLALDPLLNRNVAIKVIDKKYASDPQFRSRFRREIQIIASLKHDAIARIYDVSEDNEEVFVVMEYLPDSTLRQRLERYNSLALQDVSLIVIRLGEALETIHAQGLAHLDIKPSNIIFDVRGLPYLDFSLIQVEQETDPSPTMAVGTIKYRAPEQLKGYTPDERTDVYQLGVLIFEMLTGMNPFYEADLQSLYHKTDLIPSASLINPSLPTAIDAILQKALARDPVDRFQRPIELVSSLLHAAKLDHLIPLINTDTEQSSTRNILSDHDQKYIAYAICRIKAHTSEDSLYLNNLYILQAGIRKQLSIGFIGESIALPDIEEEIHFQIVVHAEDMTIKSDRIQTFVFRRDEETPLVEFILLPTQPGSKRVWVEFLHQNKWLASIELEFKVISARELSLTT